MVTINEVIFDFNGGMVIVQTKTAGKPADYAIKVTPLRVQKKVYKKGMFGLDDGWETHPADETLLKEGLIFSRAYGEIKTESITLPFIIECDLEKEKLNLNRTMDHNDQDPWKIYPAKIPGNRDDEAIYSFALSGATKVLNIRYKLQAALRAIKALYVAAE